MTFKVRNRLISLFLLVLSISFFIRPQPAYAQFPVYDPVAFLQAEIKGVTEKIGKFLWKTGEIAVRNALSAFLGKLAYDAAVWVASAGTGQQGLVYDEPVGEYFKEAGLAAGGGVVDALAETTGLDAAGLCDPGAEFRIGLTIGLDVQQKPVYKPSCTLTELRDNWREAYSDPNFGDYLKLQFDSTANPLGISLEAATLTIVAQAEAEEAAKAERQASSFRDVAEAVSKTINTPGSFVEQKLVGQEVATQNAVWQMFGDPAVDALAIFSSTLVTKLLERAQQGLANLSAGTELAGLISGEATGVARGRAAAQETFAELRQPTFVASGVFDILAELGSCPEDPELEGINNCAIGQTMQLAITEGWTVQEFIDYQEDIGGSYRFADDSLESTAVVADNGITRKGITLLKKYRIVPVGWQVAADYLTEATSEEVTLKNLVDCYNACGSEDDVGSCTLLLTDENDVSTNYSPFCRFIDPTWVLKAPQNFCEREAPGPDVTIQDIDNDANEFTQNEVLANRLNYCADSRGCIQEEQEDVCTAYGYCTDEERIYRFDGETCETEYAGCQTFEDADGNEVSYVKSSLNYNDCATDPGCQWYCTSQSDTGEFDCASPTETYISCSEDVATNETDYGLTYDVQYNENQVCSCEATQTCSVPAGSESGDYRECLVANSDGTESVCTLDDNCGASNSTYNSATEECTCTITNSCSVNFGDTSCTISVEADDGSSATHTCTLSDEDSSGSADSCSEDYSTYTTSPVCEVSGSGILDCGDTCTTEVGGTCVNSLGNSCIDGDTTYDADGTADGDCTLKDNCSITSGQSSCTSSAGNVCVLGTQAEDPTVENATLYFDNNIEECESSEAGCTQYIRIASDTNFIPNAFFDYYDTERNTINDSNGDGNLDPTVDGDDLAFCTHDGDGCSTDNDCDENSDGTPEGSCIGWLQDGVTAYLLNGDFNALIAPDVGTNYVQIPADTSGTGTFEITVDTGSSVENRTFTFAFRAMSLGSSCSDVAFTIGTADGAQVSASVTADPEGTDYSYTSEWQDYSTTYTFPDEDDADATYSSSGPGTQITVAISESASCDINIGGAELVEDDEFDDSYTNYAATNVTYLNDATSCEPEDVGCELYIEDGKSEDEGIPGIITNPDSDACVNDDGSYDYDNPSCSQCNGDPTQDQSDDYYVGCSFYQEVPLDSTIPLTDVPTWLTAGTDTYNGVIKRLGGYCEVDSSTHCYVDSDCGSGACIDSVSIVPSSGTECAAADVGCEEYTNLAAVEEGGEGLEYYTSLQQCVRTDDQDTAVFYTFEGSDVGGVQIEDHTLKVDDATGAPCTHLDPQSEDYNADCIDDTYSSAEQDSWDCGSSGDLDGDGVSNDSDTTTDDSEYGTDADCRQYVDADGKIYYRYESQVIKASDECTPLRSSLDTRAYFAIPGESNSCSLSAVSCREYRGTNSGSEETIIDEGFDDNSTSEWSGAESTSNESVLQSGYSLQLHDSNSSTSNAEIKHELFTQEDTDADGTEETVGLLEGGAAYILTFWANVSDGGSLTAAFDFDTTSSGGNYYFTTNGSSTSASSITLDPNDEGGWQYYIAGPVILPEGENIDEGDEYFVLQFTGDTATSEAFIDTVLLTQSNSQYLIQDSSRTCNDFEGCREYEDRDGTTQYLKSFQRLCEDEVVGCEAMITTQNSMHPFTEAYNMDNEYDEDDVIVPYDQPTTLVFDEDRECSSEFTGCIELGLPDVDERTGQVNDFESVYLLDQPDNYASTLCEQPQLSCREYTSPYDGTIYFRDPGEKVCEVKEYTFEGNTYKGWFQFESESSAPDCPVQYDFSDLDVVYASQPLGGVCNSNSVSINADGSINDNRVGKLCNQNADCYPDGWSSGDPRPRCISSFNDDVDVRDGGVHQYVTTTNDGVTLSDTVSDFGWAGSCPDEQSGCSEYIDPYSPNIEEINRNWSFEDDVRDDDNVYYASDDTATGFPDFWTIPFNLDGIDSDGDGNIGADEYTGVDIDADGTADITSSTCTTSNVLQTTAANYTGDSVSAAEGAAAVAIDGNCLIENSKYQTLEPDKTYVIQAQAKMDKALLDTGSNTPAEFSVGVHYYVADTDADADELSDLVAVDDIALYPVADHATIDFEDGSDTDNLSYWYRWQGNIGLGTTASIPTFGACTNSTYTTSADCTANGYTWTEQLATYARVFIVNHSSSTIYFDAVSFKEADKYYYLDYTVDGSAEREQKDGTNSCVDQDTDAAAITSDGGCVAFRDITSDSQNYSQDGLDCTTCLLTPNSDSCRYVVDACDTNSVLKVKKDRVCSEWLACETASLVEDDNGNITTQCFEINRCTQLDEDGNCVSWVPKPSYDQLSSSTDLHYTSATSDVDTLQTMRNLTGYSKVGVTWNDVLFCDGGPNDGKSCKSDDDCVNTSITCDSSVCSNDSSKACTDAYDCYGDDDVGTCSEVFATEGYYPYGWMQEIGLYGAQPGEDLIELRDFEALYCTSSITSTTVPCIENATTTDPGHCYTNDLQQQVEVDSTDELVSFSDVVYVDSGGSTTGENFLDDAANAELMFCPNSPSFGNLWPFGKGSGLNYTEDGWSAIGEASSVFVTQYQQYKECDPPCSAIDLNNVLQVGPALTDNENFTGGAQYDLQDNIVQGGSYALSFDARYEGEFTTPTEGGTPSAVTICLDHNNILDSSNTTIDRKDCFVRGFGMADIVFIIDTSNSMDDNPYTDSSGTTHSTGGPIANVTVAVPQLAEDLVSSGIDAQFAIVDMESSNTLELDLTSDTDTVKTVINNYLTTAGASVDPWQALTETINNTFTSNNSTYAPSGSLSYRSGTQPIIVLVTDTHDEQRDNEYDKSSVQTLIEQVNFPIVVVTTDDDSDTYNEEEYYSTIAALSGGDVTANIADADWTTGTDAVNSTILEIVIDNVDIFQFTSSMETYTLGPLTIEERYYDADAGEAINGAIETDLEFLGSDTSSFQIDNVSLLPVLEVNKDLDPISRSCRAYPETDSLQCTYVQPTGTQFKGWKGYCLETDPFSGNCITWWPLDILEGEESIVTREPAGYTGRASVYHCLVSRGMSRPAFCDEDDYESSGDSYENDWGEGVLCSGDADGVNDDTACTGTTDGEGCFYGANYTLPDSTLTGLIEHNDVDDVYSEKLTTSGGECLINQDLSSGCSSWPTAGFCSDSAYDDETECTDAGETWSEELDIMNESEVLSTGECVDIEGDYDDEFGDSVGSESDVDEICFYDLDGTGGAEVRSTRECTSNTECQTATPDSFDCAQLQCQNGDFSEACTVEEGESECANVAAAHVNTPYEVQPLRWQMHDPAAASSGTYNEGIITRLPANEILRNIHVSEMEVIEFNPGSAGEGGGSHNEYPFWGQKNGTGGSGMYDLDGETLQELGNVWLTDLKQGAIELDDDGTILDAKRDFNCYVTDEGERDGFGCRYWGLWDADLEWDNYTVSLGDHGYDLVYTFVWSQFDQSAKHEGDGCKDGEDADNPLRAFGTLKQTFDDWFDSECVDSAFNAIAGPNVEEKRNPFDEHIDEETWDDIYVDNITTQTAKTIAIDADDIDNWDGWGNPNDGENESNGKGGSNLMGLYLDFNDEGYLQAIYVLLWFSAYETQDTPFGSTDAGVETTLENMMHLNIQTRESCLLIAESVDSTNANQAWAQRITGDGTEYEINHGTDDAYISNTLYEPYGSITPLADTPDTSTWDFLETALEAINGFSTLGKQPVMTIQDAEVTAGVPLTCIGDCSTKTCVGDPQEVGTSCSSQSDCVDGMCIGVGSSTISGEGLTAAYTSGNDQVEGVVDEARNRLKFVLAGVKSGQFYRADFGSSTLYNDDDIDYWAEEIGNPTTNIFDTMTRCDTDDGERPADLLGDDSEYCGVYPTVSGISINGETGGTSDTYPISNGQTVELEFTANVDGEQKPLNLIYIDWGDGSEPTEEKWEAEPATFTYTHAYTCGPDNGARYDSGDQVCYFTPKIVIIDNWNWCSGNKSGTCSAPGYGTQEACTDHSTIDTPLTWTTGGDHRYTADGSANLITNCESYDEPAVTIKVNAAS